MIYISKGTMEKSSAEQSLRVNCCGQSVPLTDQSASLWLAGRFSFAAPQPEEETAVRSLGKQGLLEWEPEDTAASRYRILTRCILCPVKTGGKAERFLSGLEAEVLFWLQNAGIRLSLAELSYLAEHKISPAPSLLHEENRQALIEAIYTQDTIGDNLLEQQMESAKCRDEVAEAVLKLLLKREIVLL